jgi:hypothetical protein
VDDIQDVDQDATQIEENQKGKRIGMYVHVPDFHRSVAQRTPKEKFNKIHSPKV